MALISVEFLERNDVGNADFTREGLSHTIIVKVSGEVHKSYYEVHSSDIILKYLYIIKSYLCKDLLEY